MERVSPLVSIIIPTYNRKDFLRETLNSVLSQNFNDWECIVVDDRSTDGTEVMVREYIDKDSRLKIVKKPLGCPKGAPSSRNIGFSSSTGTYIQWLDDDDLMSKNKLSMQVENLKKINNPNVYAMCSWDFYWPNKQLELQNIFGKREYVEKKEFFNKLGEGQTFIPSLAYLTPRKLILKAGLWNSALSINQDAEFFARILINSDYIVNIEDCHVLYRQHEGVRISGRRKYENIESFFLSLNLIQSYLKSCNIEAKNYFRWKLLKWFLTYRKSHSHILKKHYYLFKENGIDLNYSHYYCAKHAIYKIVHPWYKTLRKKKIS